MVVNYRILNRIRKNSRFDALKANEKEIALACVLWPSGPCIVDYFIV
jgi:hypothetical protein